jgi:2-polyprenyl-3-methyl-5-hydroxy-6-metoxy-1,4-benzoquinol methylase
MSLPPIPAARANLYARSVRDLRDATAVDVSPCPVCRESRARPRFAVEGVSSRVVVCEGCGLGRFEPMLAPDEVSAFYPDEYYGQPGVKFHPLVEGLVRAVGARHIAFLTRGLAPGARVLDVGCGRGVILGPLADRGLEVHGVEVSAEASRGADPRAQVRVAPQLADAGYPDAHFDEVVIWHVLEHLADPRATLVEVRRILKPGGRLVVAVPNFSSAQARWSGSAWFHLDLPRHLYQFPLEALRRLLDDVGFEVATDHHFSLRQNPFGWIQSALNRISWLPRNGLYTMLHRRSRGEARAHGPALRAVLWLLAGLLAPPALLATLLETAVRSGATVHVVAFRGQDVPLRAAPHPATRPASSPA